jgi:hypothetical protein
MKFKSYLFIFIYVSFAFGCNKDRKGISFSMEYNEQFSIENGSPLQLPIRILLPPTASHAEATFAQNDTRADKITSIRLEQLVLELQKPENEDFSFLEEMQLFISTKELPELLLAEKKNIQNNTRSLRLDTSKEDFKEYIKSGEYTLRVRTVIKRTFSNKMDLSANIIFKASAKLL